MSDEPTPRQQLLLWDLVSRGGSAMRKDLKPEVGPADRGPLERRGFISVTKERGNAIRLTMEEPGWDHLAGVAPTLLASGAGSIHDRRILQFVLARIQAYASREGLTFARIFVPARTDAPDTASSIDLTGIVESALDLESEVEAAFFELAGRPPVNHVRLAALRARLGGKPRAELDRALVVMRTRGRVSLSTLSNPADIAREGDAPLVIDGRTFHTLWIDP